MSFDVPVVLMVYRRPALTAQVMAALAAVRPSRLFVVADAPEKPEMASSCEAARTIATSVDWPCDVRVRIAERHLGVGLGPPTGLTWVFDQVERAVILEDDCVPALSFFGFCRELLDRYADDERLLEVGGSNLQFGRPRGPSSYYFSKYPSIWGWATWRRAWRLYDRTLATWPAVRDHGLFESMMDSRAEQDFWRPIFDRMHRGVGSWDYAWHYALWAHHGLSATPNVNLITNVGFGPTATQTLDAKDGFAALPRREIGAIAHPPLVVRDRQADAFLFRGVRREVARSRARGVVRRLGRALRLPSRESRD